MRTELGRKAFKITFPFVLLYLAIFITMQFEVIAEYFYARFLSRGISFVFQKINSIFPFSISELLLVGIVATVVIFIIVRIFQRKDITILSFTKFVKFFIVTVFTVATLYTAMGTALYNRKTVAWGLGLDTDITVTDKLMFDATLFYLNGIVEAEKELTRGEDGYIVNPYTFREVNNKINAEYDRQLSKNKYFSKNNVKVKPIVMSEPMLYTGIIGVYLAPLGEASVNTNVVSYDLPVTMAHEMAHSKGVVKENEANFTAYYLCINSNDAFLRYSGYFMAMIDCLASVQSKEARAELRELIPTDIWNEYVQSYEYYSEYRGITQKISEFFNNLNLITSGVDEGVASYGLTQHFLGALYSDLNTK